MVRREKIKVLWLKPKKGQVSIDRTMIADNLSVNYDVSVMEVSISRIPHIIMNLALSSGGGGRNTLARRAFWQGYSKDVMEGVVGEAGERFFEILTWKESCCKVKGGKKEHRGRNETHSGTGFQFAGAVFMGEDKELKYFIVFFKSSLASVMYQEIYKNGLRNGA